MAAAQATKDLDALIQEMLKRARLALQQSGATPLQRASARALLACHEDMGQKRQAYDAAKEARQRARLDRRFAQATANMTTAPTDWRSRALRTIGLPTAEDREAHTAQDQKQQAKAQEQQARQARETAREARNRAVVAFDEARSDFMRQFPQYFPGIEDQPSQAPRSLLQSPFIDTPEFSAPPCRQPRPGPLVRPS